jgi:hypothetical protein
MKHMASHRIVAAFGASFTLLASGAVAVAARAGSRRDGDVVMAIFASYGIGQFMPFFSFAA